MRAELRELRKHVVASFDRAEEVGDEALLRRIDEVLLSPEGGSGLTASEKARRRRELFASFRGLDILQKLLDDPTVTEIMVNGTESIFVEREGRLEPWENGFEDRETLEDVIQTVAGGVNRIVNTASPIADLRLPDGSRINVVLPPVSAIGPVMTIRKFSREPLTMEKLVELGSLSREAAEFLRLAVGCGINIFISGGTSSGKTTFLNALSAFIPAGERVITIEDSLELQLQGLPNLIRLETREANTAGEGRIGIRELIRTSLRMRPDRIIVGEVRGAEALDMLQAMNTGHRGSLSTGHANSGRDMLSRLEVMVLEGAGELPLYAVRSQIASALELVVHLGRQEDRVRRVLSIEEITGLAAGEVQTAVLFRREPGQGLVYTGCRLKRQSKWRETYGCVPFEEGKLQRLWPDGP